MIDCEGPIRDTNRLGKREVTSVSQEKNEGSTGSLAKVLLLAFPFVLLVIFVLLEGWIW